MNYYSIPILTFVFLYEECKHDVNKITHGSIIQSTSTFNGEPAVLVHHGIVR